jgi:hypothetical protein
VASIACTLQCIMQNKNKIKIYNATPGISPYSNLD